MEIRNDVFKAISGDNQAMERLYTETYPKLRAVTISILKNEDDAEDIIQESYIKAFSSLDQLDDAEKFDSWLCRIASNKCKDYLKKHKPVLFSEFENDDDEDPYEWSIEDDSKDYNPEEVAISDDTRRQLMELVNSLPDEQRICLVYYAVEEMKISEIAQLLEVSESTVKSRLKYAKDKMKNKIEDLEKKGVKIRSVSGFALVPFMHYLFATEAKAASVATFTAISEAVAALSEAGSAAATTATASTASAAAKTVAAEVVKQAGTKAAAGLAAKIASMPLVAKIAAGVVAVCVAVGTPVAIYNAVDSGKANVEDAYVEEVQNENLYDYESLNEQIDFEETVIIDDENFMMKVLDIHIDEEYNYILESELHNKTDKIMCFCIDDLNIDGVVSYYGHCYGLSPNETLFHNIVINNKSLSKYSNKFSEIIFSACLEDATDYYDEDMNMKDAYTKGDVVPLIVKPIYPFGKNNVKKFNIGDNYSKVIYSDEGVNFFCVECTMQDEDNGCFEVVLYVDNQAENYLYLHTWDYKINNRQVENYFSDNEVYGTTSIPKNHGMFEIIKFYKPDLINVGINDIKTLVFDADLTSYFDDDYRTCFNELVTIRFARDKHTDEISIDNSAVYNNVHFIGMGETCRYDINGDGKKEEICATAQLQSSKWVPYFYNGSVNVTIDGKRFENVYNGEYWLSNYYCIIDIDNSDSKLHLAIQDYGPSSDYSSAIFEYNYGNLNYIGTIRGVFDPGYGFYDTVCHGDGTIGSYMRFRVLHTWFGKTHYKLENSKIEWVEQEYYDATSQSSHTLLVDLTVYENNSLISEKNVLSKGSKVSILGTDNKEWLKIETSDSKNYWIKMIPGEYFSGDIQVDGETVMSGSEVFDWLSFAD